MTILSAALRGAQGVLEPFFGSRPAHPPTRIQTVHGKFCVNVSDHVFNGTSMARRFDDSHVCIKCIHCDHWTVLTVLADGGDA